MKNTVFTLGVFVIGSLLVSTGCSLISEVNMGGGSPVDNRQTHSPSIFEKLPMENSFDKATTSNKKRALKGMHEIHQALISRKADMSQLERPFSLLINSNIAPEHKLYSYYLFANYPPPNKFILGKLESHLEEKEEGKTYEVRTVKGKTVRGSLQDWGIRALLTMLEPELNEIYGTTPRKDEILSLPLKKNKKKLKHWIMKNYKFLEWNQSRNGFELNRNEKRIKQKEEEKTKRVKQIGK